MAIVKVHNKARNITYVYESISYWDMEAITTLHTLSAAKAPRKDGKGSPYADIWNCHMPLFDAMMTEARKSFRRVR